MKSSRTKISISFLLISGLLLLHFFVPCVITEIRNPVIELLKGKREVPSKHAFSSDSKLGRQIKYLSVDSTKIVAYETYATADSVRGTVILLHGIRAYKEHFKEFSKQLAAEGFNAIAMDLRGHGASGGKHCTFGVLEKQDVSKLVDLLREENESLPIGVFGQSLGGAVGLQSLGYDKRIAWRVSLLTTFLSASEYTSLILRYSSLA